MLTFGGGNFSKKTYISKLTFFKYIMKPKTEMILWAVLYIILIFVITGIMGIWFHGVVPSEGPAIWKFLYAGLINFWDTILGLVVGGFLVYSFIKKK